MKGCSTAQKEVAKFLIRDFRTQLRSVYQALRHEVQVTRDGVTEGMKNTMADVRHWDELLKENVRLQTETLEKRVVKVESTSGGRSDGLKPARPDTFSGDRSKGKDWLRTILHYMELRPRDFPSDEVRIGWTISFFKEGRANGFAQEAYDYKDSHEDKWQWATWTEFLTVFQSEFYVQEAETSSNSKLRTTTKESGAPPTIATHSGSSYEKLDSKTNAP